MGLIVDPEERKSAWQEPAGRQPEDGQVLRVTLTELQMILHLRMLESGGYMLYVRKDGRGQWGLRSFRLAPDGQGEQTEGGG